MSLTSSPERKTDRLFITIEPSLMDRTQRVAELLPEYEGKRAPVIRHAIREFVEKKEREIAARDEQATGERVA